MRVFIDKQVPTAYKALSAVAAEVRSAASSAGLSRAFMELVNVRVSQMNRCVFCLDLHSRLALEAGETEQRLAILPAWRDTELFDAKEKAALRLAEAVTSVGGEHLEDDEYAAAAQHLNEDELAVVVWGAIAINAFNRVSILSRHPIKRR